MLSDWRSGIVDLTLDSDSEDDVHPSLAIHTTLPFDAPLPGPSRSSNASSPTARPKNINANVPLPGSTPQLSHTNKHMLANRIHTSNGVSLSKSSSGSLGTAIQASMNENSARTYAPSPSNAHDETNDVRNTGPSKKRRKLSAHGGRLRTTVQESTKATTSGSARLVHRSMQQSNGSASRTDSDHDMHAQQAPAPGRLSNTSTSAKPTNKAPSVQYMNEALRTKGATSLLVDRVAKNGPRPLQIGRMHSSGVFELRGSSSTTPTDPVPPSPQEEDIVSYKSRSTKQSHSRSTPILLAPPQAANQGRPAARAVKSEISKFKAQKSRNLNFSDAVPTRADDDEDSVMSDVTLPAGHEEELVSVKQSISYQQLPLLPTSKPATKSTQSKAPSHFSEEEEHLLIFLKEVKKFQWKVITSEFAKDIPGRPYHALQTRYTKVTNQRNRSQDPAVLKLPSRWAAEAVINWAAVHAETSGPRGRVRAANLNHDVGTAVTVAPKRAKFRHEAEQDYSSGTDSAARQPRPRRAPLVNYDIRRLNRHVQEDMDEADFDDPISQSRDVDRSIIMRSESPSQPQVALPATAHVVVNEPLDMQFSADDARLGLIAGKGVREPAHPQLPYLASSACSLLQDPPEGFDWDQLASRDWQGCLLHVDFSPEELEQVHQALVEVHIPLQKSRHSTQRRQWRTVVSSLAESKRLQLAQAIRRRLPARDSSSVNAFLEDAQSGRLAASPRILRLSAARPQKSTSFVHNESMTSMLRQREIGSCSRRGWQKSTKPITYQTKNKLLDTLGPSSSWTGASSDIHTVTWSQDGDQFAAGAVAVTDRDSMQYNRPNNLLFSNLADSTIHELAEHSIDREKTDSGANSTHAMFVSQDPKLYTTVTSVAFSPSGKLMYSAGYDESVCIWHLEPAPSQPILAAKLRHKGEVEMMVANNHFDGVLATAAKRTSGAPIKLLTLDEDDPSRINKHNFHSEKAVSRSDLRLLPQALRFEPRYGGLLLAGFGANVRDDHVFDITGDLCLWDIEAQAQISIHGSNRNVFDVTFNPNRRYMPLFAAGCVASTNVNRGTRSVIRLYNEKGSDKYTCPLEIECRALDMNDVVWCPQDEHLITAGCTDGRVYVWDMRNPDDPLMTLSHGHSLMPLQDGTHHERTDTGVRFLSWGDNATRLYSGSSDGVVKVWDVTRSAEDAFIKDLITLDSGIMAGAFSPDFSMLLLGEVNGSVNVLDVGRDDCTIRDAEKLRYVPYAGDANDQDSTTGDPVDITATESGVAEGKHLLHSQQLQVIPMGDLPIRQVVQGPSYEGPFDQSVDAPFLREQALEFQLGMTASSGSQCGIAACKDNIVTVTYEETGDSGRSSDRIPDELRRQWTAVDSNTRIMPGKTKCMHCSRPARPFCSDDPNASVLCERCSFACFRCGAVNPIDPATTTLICDTCAGVWEIGALGYECIEQPALTKFRLDVPHLRQYGRDMLLKWSDERTISYGDEVNALTDYYHSLAIDRPQSPPL